MTSSNAMLAFPKYGEPPSVEFNFKSTPARESLCWFECACGTNVHQRPLDSRTGESASFNWRPAKNYIPIPYASTLSGRGGKNSVLFCEWLRSSNEVQFRNCWISKLKCCPKFRRSVKRETFSEMYKRTTRNRISNLENIKMRLKCLGFYNFQ